MGGTPLRLSLAWLIGVISAVVGAGLIGAVVVLNGWFDTTASSPHHRLVAQITHTTMVHAVHDRAKSIRAPDRFTPRQVQLGFTDYEQRCVACHGGPATPRAPFAAAMTPTPPYLLDAAKRWSPAELYWIVHNGVKMTAMPAWGEVESDDRVWNLVAFLEALPRISAADYLRMRTQAATSTTQPHPQTENHRGGAPDRENAAQY